MERRIDSVEWPGRKPDWWESRDKLMKGESWENIADSRSLDARLMRDTGR